LLPTVNAIWIGPQLGPINTACLRSFRRHGHRVVLHCYERPSDTPEGVQLADASTLLPQSRIIRHRETGSLALFSDILRYEIIGKGLGIYVDCDVFCLRPIEDADYIFGWESDTFFASGVLKLPPDCPALSALRAIKNTVGFVPPWQKNPPRKPTPLEDLPWGTIGPRALTYYVREYGLEGHGSPIDRFNPVHWSHTELLFDPALRLADLTTHRTDAVHLFNHAISRIERRIPQSSPLWEVINSEDGEVGALQQTRNPSP